MTPPDEPIAGSPIRTARLLVRCWEPRDAAPLKAAIDASLDHLRAWMPWAHREPSPLEAVELRLAGFRREFLAGRDWAYGIFDAAGHEVLGGAGLHARAAAGALEMGYWIRAGVTGRGYATEAARALTTVAFTVLRAHRLEIRCDPRNLASAGVPRRLGYHHVQTLVADTVTPAGAPRDTMVWLLTRAEHAAWPP
jgi:RimJ/RimL family protein N-acetyltransferase